MSEDSTMIDRDGVEHLTPNEHLERADKALAHATRLRKEMDDREVADGRTQAKSSQWYLTREHDFLTLIQIVNVHANMATAKGIGLLLDRGNAPIEFAMPTGGQKIQYVDRSGKVLFDSDALTPGADVRPPVFEEDRNA